MDDVLVIGGGPGGATAAALLASHGVNVTLLERTRFPRHHVGESLQPSSLKLLEKHFGLKQQLSAQGFARKYGAVYVWGESRNPWSVLFDERLDTDLPDLTETRLLAGDYECALQVDRAVFDRVLLDNARNLGVNVLEEHEAIRPVLEGNRVKGVLVRANGQTKTLSATSIIDATGQRCLLGRTFGTIESLPDLQATATYGYFQGAGGVPGPLGRHVQFVVTTPMGWIWFIPVSATLTSVGVVHHERRKMNEADFLKMLNTAGLPMEDATLIEHQGSRLRHVRDWSYKNTEVAGENWLMVGDAAAFIDPILSGGVDFAIRGGCNAALALLRAHTDSSQRHAAIQEYANQVQTEHKAYLKLARYWYGNNRSVDGFFWTAYDAIKPESGSTALRAFVYLTSGKYSTDRHFKVFAGWQEKTMFRALGVDRTALKARLQKVEKQ